MAHVSPDHFADDDGPNLKDPVLAGCLGWLVPGLGHLYQGRWAKGILFLLCILGTFGFGLYQGGGRVVYASLRPNDRRLAYLCQIGVGLPALPALVQAQRFRSETLREQAEKRARIGQARFFDWFMVPPQVRASDDPRQPEEADELDDLHRRLHRFFELGTVYTMIAGLLNVLAIYDACGGPAFSDEEPEARRREKPEEVQPVRVEILSVLNVATLLGMHSGDVWYALPLIVVISLVYQATRHEHMGAILWGAARFGLWLLGFMAAASAILYFISIRL